MDTIKLTFIQRIRRNCNLYPPECLNFFKDDEFPELENEIASYCSSHKNVILSGDFNARTSEMRDYTECDKFLTEMFDFDTADTINCFQ